MRGGMEALQGFASGSPRSSASATLKPQNLQVHHPYNKLKLVRRVSVFAKVKLEQTSSENAQNLRASCL